MTIKTPEQIAHATLDANLHLIQPDGRGYDEADVLRITRAAIEADRAQRPDPTADEFAHPDDEDAYRDLWNENMPRVSGRMYFAIPGEQPIHVTDEEAHHIMTYLSEQNR